MRLLDGWKGGSPVCRGTGGCVVRLAEEALLSLDTVENPSPYSRAEFWFGLLKFRCIKLLPDWALNIASQAPARVAQRNAGAFIASYER